MHLEWIYGEDIKQVVLPACKRRYILSVAHDISFAGHLSEQKIKQRIKYSFYWSRSLRSIVRVVNNVKSEERPCIEIEFLYNL